MREGAALAIDETVRQDADSVKLLWRTTRPDDLDQCVALLRDHFLYDVAALDDLRLMWLDVITRDIGRSAVVFEAGGPQHVLAFGVSVALSEARFEAICANRRPFVGKELLDDWRTGSSPFLDEASFASANSGGGLHVVVTHNGVSETHAELLSRALSVMSESFIALHAGINMKGIVHEAFGVPREFASDLGLRVSDYAPAYETVLADVPNDRTPLIVSMTRDHAIRHPGNLAMHQVFLRFTPPRCSLRREERRLLRFALEGAADDTIAQVLQIAPRTLKKRWADIYVAMEPVTGIAPGLGNGKRGAEVRRHVLRYVRDHPEELHAFVP